MCILAWHKKREFERGIIRDYSSFLLKFVEKWLLEKIYLANYVELC